MDGSRCEAKRLRRLPWATALGREVRVAADPRARLLGLAGLESEEAGLGLLIPRCTSVHTFFMRFPLDLVFLTDAGRPLRSFGAVPPRRLVWCRAAAAVLEVPAGLGGEFLLPES